MMYEDDVPTENRVDLAYSGLDLFPEHLSEKADRIRSLHLNNNRILVLPRAVSLFQELRHLDISANGLTHVSGELTHLPNLRTFIAKNNLLEDGALPKELGRCLRLEVLNLSGNGFTEFPEQLAGMAGLRALYFGANRLRTVPSEIKHMSRKKVEREIRKAKKQFYKINVENHKNYNPKSWHRNIKAMCNMKQKTSHIPVPDIDQNDYRAIANAINVKLASVSQSLPPLDMCSLPAFLPAHPVPTINVWDVYNRLKSTNCNKSPGPDGVPARILKEFAFQRLAPTAKKPDIRPTDAELRQTGHTYLPNETLEIWRKPDLVSPPGVGESVLNCAVLLFLADLRSSTKDVFLPPYRLEILYLGGNQISSLPLEVGSLLEILYLGGNQISSLPLEVGLEILYLGGNQISSLPLEVGLEILYLGGNQISSLPLEVGLEILYLGGNQISSLPVEVGSLSSLMSLVLCDNRLESIPPHLARLRNLRSLSLHNNRIAALPSEIIALRNLTELSLRGNPLVVNFVRDLSYDPPTLLELAGRGVKNSGIPYGEGDVPPNLYRYLSLARKCPNPKCTGVYFDARVKQIKFVDFCGKYRLPLQQYLCSPRCTAPSPVTSSESESDEEGAVPSDKIRRVLLG
ncbi:LRRC58 [Branchiostoma lanceolatum]|uniref:LRRC58 protein n=1 Tax=Branchiostoma lanceolatum TaxID=7740 RepID=A0A8K0A5V6_BRALA|nr:LRRC58 [Branchiostoma lanceolatum]